MHAAVLVLVSALRAARPATSAISPPTTRRSLALLGLRRQYTSATDAAKGFAMFNGRTFDGQRVVAVYFDEAKFDAFHGA